MTYIIAGKLPNTSFMMTDCIVTNAATNQKTFMNKIIKLESSHNTFYSFTGVQFIDNCVRTYDFWLSMNKRQNDFIRGENSINELVAIIIRMLETFNESDNMTLSMNRLFFLDNQNVVYYDLEFNEKNELINNAKKNTVNENEFIDSSVLTDKKEGIPNSDIENFCKNYLDYLSKKEVDFKNRFSFVQLNEDGTIKFKEPFKKFSDLIAMYNQIDYSKIDDENFTWTI